MVHSCFCMEPQERKLFFGSRSDHVKYDMAYIKDCYSFYEGIRYGYNKNLFDVPNVLKSAFQKFIITAKELEDIEQHTKVKHFNIESMLDGF